MGIHVCLMTITYEVFQVVNPGLPDHLVISYLAKNSVSITNSYLTVFQAMH